MKTQNKFTTADFYDYLNSLKLLRRTIKDEGHSFTAVLMRNCEKPKLENFSQVTKGDDGCWVVRLGKGDLFHEAIVGDFFAKRSFLVKTYIQQTIEQEDALEMEDIEYANSLELELDKLASEMTDLERRVKEKILKELK